MKAEGEANWKFNVVENREAYTCTLGLNGDAGNVYYRNDGTIIGSGKCDLSTAVCDNEGNVWKITTHKGTLMFNSSAANMTELIYPKTMTSLTGQFLEKASTSLTNVVIDCPEATGAIGVWTFGNNPNLKRLIIKCPNITTLSGYPFRSSPLTDTDVGEWDLSGVEELVPQPNKTEPGVFQGFGGRGILRLPSVKKVGAFSFHGANNLEGVLLGTGAGTVTSIATNAFTGNCGIRKLVIGGAEGWTLAEKSITLSKGLTEIVFLTTPPAALEAGKSYFTELDTAANKCGVFVPYQSAEWSQIFAAATEVANPDDVEAYLDANEGAARPNFVLPAGVLGTQFAQLLGYAKTAEYGGTSVKVDFSTVEGFGDEIITSGNGVYSPGEVVTISANCAEGNTFYAWHGLPSGSTNVTEVSFTVGFEPLSILLHSFHSWTYDPDAKQITDGNWVLNVYVANSNQKRLGLGVNASGKTNNVAVIGSAYTGIGSGALELNGPVVNVNDPTDIWSITDFGASCFSLTDDNGNNAVQASITQLYMPTNTKTITKMMYSKISNETLKYLWINAPEFVENVVAQAFQGQKIAKASIYLPKTRSLGNRCFQDIVDVEGVLKFPYLTYFGNNAFSETKVDEVELGTGYTLRDHAKLDDGNKDNFQECLAYNPTLTKITFGPYESVSFHEKAFTGNTGYKNIVFQGKPLAKAEIDKILVSIGDITNGVNNVIINASQRLGWDEYAVDELDEEKQFYPEGVDVNKILGVYLGANNSRKAWIVDTESPFDPKGTVIIIR